jgi:PAS domain S-box-containing protein
VANPSLQQSTDLSAPSPEVVALRRCVRDIAALSALPAIWFEADLERGLQNLADVLAAALRASFVYVRVTRADGVIAETASSDSISASTRDAAALGRELDHWIDLDSLTHPATIDALGGEGPFRVAVSHIAATGRVRGFVVVGSLNHPFPTACDKLLLNTGATQIAILVQRSDVESQVRVRSQQLDESNCQLREANKELIETKKRLESTLNAAEIGTWIWKLETDQVIADNNLAFLFGLPPSVAQGAQISRYFERLHPDDRSQVEARITRAIETKSDYSAEYRVFTEDGGIRWLVARGRVECDETGKPVDLPGVVLDITERKVAENELRIARDIAEGANRAKDRFLAILSHELRTPLSPVLMTVAMMEEDAELPDRLRAPVAMIRRNIELETQLIDDLLDVSRVASGKLRLQLQGTHIHDVLKHALETCRSEISSKSLRVEQSLTAENDLVIGDPARLQQVFWNLLRNAAKFTPANGLISIRTSNVSNERIVVEVRDSGIGISAEVLPRVFTPFEQGETSVTREFGGLGLGLAICKAVVEIHGGIIRAHSEGPGHGSSFVAEFATSSPLEVTSSTSKPASSTSPHPTRNRILLVEDHADTAKTLARLLTRSGYQVTTAHTVASALEALAQQDFDILASDIGLPDQSGFELMERVRNRSGLVGIALSGFGSEEDIARAHRAGFAEHLVKPVSIAQLRAVLGRLLSIEPHSDHRSMHFA